jgi:PAP2 superfamily
MARRPYAFAIWVALAAGLVAVVGAIWLDLPLRDPDGVAGPSYIRLPAIVLAALAADIVPRAWYRTPKMINIFSTARLIIRERWTWARVRLVVIGLGCFYLSYVAYRNIKSFLPFVNSNLHDDLLTDLDRWMMFGQRPAVVLHDLLGVDFAAHALSSVYVFYLFFVPISLAFALVWSRDVHKGFWYVTALCLNWVLGAASYYVLPSLGPAYAHPGDFTMLPDTGVASLQSSLLMGRYQVLTDPHATTAVHGIAAFASLHVSVVLTAALIAHRIGLPRWVRAALWFYTGITVVATVYFGWHYLADDVAGAVIGYVSVALAARATGFDMWSLRRIPPEKLHEVESGDGSGDHPPGGRAPAPGGPAVPSDGAATDGTATPTPPSPAQPPPARTPERVDPR